MYNFKLHGCILYLNKHVGIEQTNLLLNAISDRLFLQVLLKGTRHLEFKCA